MKLDPLHLLALDGSQNLAVFGSMQTATILPSISLHSALHHHHLATTQFITRRYIIIC